MIEYILGMCLSYHALRIVRADRVWITLLHGRAILSGYSTQGMQHNLTTQKEVMNWLLARGLSEPVIDANLKWDDATERIVIPIYDANGKWLFNKYRRSPFSGDGPKYTYDAGGKLVLYGAHKQLADTVFICEGELDALLLESLGISAVTSTGGAQSFQRSWGRMLEGREVFICLDNDDAGVKGAIRIQRFLPKAQCVALPPGDAKDVTEFIGKYGLKKFLEIKPRCFFIPEEPDMLPTKKESLKELVGQFTLEANTVMIEQRTDGSPYLEAVRLFLLERAGYYKHALKAWNPIKAGHNDDRVVLAKKVPITRYISFDARGFAKCLWHDEKTGSMKYNHERSKLPNTVHCFGACGKTFDSIDVVMQIENVNFTEAVNRLLNEK